jgi:hypothetical protein
MATIDHVRTALSPRRQPSIRYLTGTGSIGVEIVSKRRAAWSNGQHYHE